MKTHHGFTLVEMAIVIFLISLIAGSMLISLTTQMDVAKIQNTKKTLEDIKEALLSYAALNGRLPCLSELDSSNKPNGIAVSPPCGTDKGYLPWIDLNMSPYDAWGNPFRYRVDNTIVVLTGNQQLPSGTVAAVVFSCGKNGLPEGENDDTNNTYRQDAYIPDGANYFDDNLVWLSRNLLNYRLATARRNLVP
jgi:prepilin-type N-terminal cleavage/methylation domain-containing protein